MQKIPCTFFGHSDCPSSVIPMLSETLENLIVAKGVNLFYVGHQGSFDRHVQKVLNELKIKYSHIACYIVLAYLPRNNEKYCFETLNTIYPTELENVPLKFAIDHRNKWLLHNSKYAVVYVKHNYGGAAKFVSSACHAGKTVINIADKPDVLL